jgi:hypothetical protein
MINFNKEYFSNNCYFFLKEREDKISLYYSVADTLTESRKKDDKKDFKKKDLKKVKNIVNKFLSSKEKVTKKDIDKELSNISSSGEIEELVDSEGGLLNTRTPYLNMALHPRKTMDQTITMTRTSNDPITRGYRVYYGENTENDANIVSEINYSDAFGFEETENMDFKNTVNTLKKMGVENAVHRAKELGKLPKAKKRNGKLRQRLSEKDSIEEQEKQKMVKMVEDILAKKSNKDSDILKKDNDSSVSKILIKNLQSIKKLADKEGINISKLINILKTSE